MKDISWLLVCVLLFAGLSAAGGCSDDSITYDPSGNDRNSDQVPDTGHRPDTSGPHEHTPDVGDDPNQPHNNQPHNNQPHNNQHHNNQPDPNLPDTALPDPNLPDTDLPDTELPEPIPPTVEITAAPGELTNSPAAQFEFDCSATDCTFECSLDGPFGPCTSPYDSGILDDGPHTFMVRATDGDGLRSEEATHTWRIDTVPPEVRNVDGPLGRTNQATATITFECNEPDCTFECVFRGEPAAPCTSPVVYTDLEDGEHRIEIYATDAAGNRSTPYPRNWVVDTRPPVLEITAGPDARTYDSTAEFAFTCDKFPCTLTCSLDEGPFETCASPLSLSELGDGEHVLVVRGTDDVGNVGHSAPFVWQVVVPKWVQVGAGNNHTCALADDGSLWCWGGNTLNVLGRSGISSSPVPLQVGTDTDWQWLSVGSGTNCAIRNGGELYCWGFGSGGTAVPDTVFRKYSGNDWTRVSAGHGAHFCGLRGSGELYCWGNNNRGQLGNGQAGGSSTNPLRIGTYWDWTAVSVGFAHTCGVRAGQLFCWGENDHGQLGLGDTDRRTSPTRVGTKSNFVDTHLGFNHTFAVTSTAGPFPIYGGSAFGANADGQLGMGNTVSPRTTPYGIGLNTHFAPSDTFSCMLVGTEVLGCTGANTHGQLGTGNTTPSTSFVTIGRDFIDVAAGGQHACAIDTDHVVHCWGNNSNGRLGTGDTTARHTPTPIHWPY